MTGEPFVKLIPASTWSGTAANQCCVNDLLPKKFGSVINTSIIDQISQKFNRRLCAILFDFGQVDIVDKNDDALIGSGTKNSLGLFVKFGLNRELGFFRFGFGRKVEEDGVDAFFFDGEEVRDDE
jgi:hypothetical protein